MRCLILALVFMFAPSVLSAQDEAQDGRPFDHHEVGRSHAKADNDKERPSEPPPVSPKDGPQNQGAGDQDGGNAGDVREEKVESPVVIRWWRNYDMIAAYAGLLAVVVSFAALIILWRTLKASLAAVREAERGSEAAVAAVEETRRIGQAQLRAYLSVTEVKVIKGRDDQPFTFAATLVNSGNTPAAITSMKRFTAFVEGQVDEDFSTSAVEHAYSVNIGPGQSKVIYAANVSIELVGLREAVLRREFTAAFYLRVAYRDVFGDSHVTEVFRVANGIDMCVTLVALEEYPDTYD